MENGFGARSALGQSFDRYLKSNQTEAAAYKALGRSYNLQREFKKNWRHKQFEAISRTQRYKETSVEGEHQTGEHMPLSMIIWKQKSKRNGVNYMAECIKRTRDGQVWKGKPYCTYNGFTKCWEFLYIRRKVTSGAQRSWEIEEEGVKKRLLENVSAGSDAVPEPAVKAIKKQEGDAVQVRQSHDPDKGTPIPVP